MKNITQYIDSGILESYALGTASPEEVKELKMIRKIYPEVEMAMRELEIDMERIAGQMAITPPPGIWDRIEAEINNLMVTDREPVLYKEYTTPKNKTDKNPHYIEVESISNDMRVNKAWKWVFAAVFVLGKIFLGCAIYFYLENRQAQQQIKELKTELRSVRP